MIKLLQKLPYYLVAFILVPMLVGVAGLIILRANGYQLMSIQSGSMTPMIKKGDAVIIEPARSSQLRAGQIVTFHDHQTQTSITHRIVSIDKTGLTTKGDAVKDSDNKVAADQIIGRAVVASPGLGRLLNLFHRPIGLVVLIYAPALAVIILELIRFQSNNLRSTYLLDYKYESKRQKA